MRCETGITPKSWETEPAATSREAGTQARPTSMPKTRAEGTRQTAWLLMYFYFFYFTVSFKAVSTVLQLPGKGSSRGSSHPSPDGNETQPLGWASMGCRQDRVVGWGWESLQKVGPKQRACKVLILWWPNLKSAIHRLGVLGRPPPNSAYPS